MGHLDESMHEPGVQEAVTWFDPRDAADVPASLLLRVLDTLVLSGSTEQEQPTGLLTALEQVLRASAAWLWRRGGQWQVIASSSTVATTMATNLSAVAAGVLGEAAATGRVALIEHDRGHTVCVPLDERHCPNMFLCASLGGADRDLAVETARGLACLQSLLSWMVRQLVEHHSLAGQVVDLRALLDVTRRLAVIKNTEELLEAIASEAASLLDAERASIFIWDRERGELIARPALGVEGKVLRVPDDQGIVGAVLKGGEPTVVNDVRSDPRFSADVDRRLGFQTRNLIAVPLSDPRGRRLGVFEVLNKRSGSFTARDRWLLERLADQVAVVLENAAERDRLTRVATHYSEQTQEGAQIVGRSRAIVELRATVHRLAQTDLPVLILGESGTGKEVVARAIHSHSKRRGGPFIAINCAAIAETLLESELFGHEQGAFTDARETRPGKFELAQGGTLFLDEIGDMSPSGQAKLLRVLEEKSIYRVGGTKPIPVDVRVIAATNRDLVQRVREGQFREDLYYRLSVVAIQIPPLRQRREDVLELAEFFLDQFCRDAGRERLQLSEAAKRRLQEYGWPGNVRELRNLMERLAFLAPGPTIEGAEIERILAAMGVPRDEEGISVRLGMSLSEATMEFQRRYIREAIRLANGNVAEAGRRLGLHRSNLYRKMKQLGMDRGPEGDKP